MASELICQRCGGPNLTAWHAPSPLWNAVMRRADGSDAWSIICPQCFAELAELHGVVWADRVVWHLEPDQGVAAQLATTDPDGRVWDAELCFWREVPGG